MSIQIPFVNAYATLPDRFFAHVLPTPVKNPSLIAWNEALANDLGIKRNNLSDSELAQFFAGNQIPTGAEPLAMAYSGHQFGHLNMQLGDGRAILLGDVINSSSQRQDIQLKGSGRTPFSRRGDGRSPIGPVIREYLLCEAMNALGVPTTRALAAVQSGEYVYRDNREPGAIFTRVAASHIRVGTFQHFALRRDIEAVTILADHVLARHYPEIDQTQPDRYLQLFEAICRNQAKLIAHWMQLGFIHGVMNTDNMTVSGEGIDYGPCAFMEAFHEDTVFSSIDRQGRYAYSNQPAIGQWNLARLAEALLDLFAENQQIGIEKATPILQNYQAWQHDAWLLHMSEKLGFRAVHTNIQTLVESLLPILQNHEIDYTAFFRALSYCTNDSTAIFSLKSDESFKLDIQNWLEKWRETLNVYNEENAQKSMLAKNPAVIPRNHLVAKAIEEAEQGRFEFFNALLQGIQQPFVEHDEFSKPAKEYEKITRTFCGT